LPGDENTLPVTHRHFFPIPKLNELRNVLVITVTVSE
jgi:hypothetical protein